MKSFNTLYKKVIKASVKNQIEEQLGDKAKLTEFDDHHLDCLLNPEKQPPVIRLNNCSCTDAHKSSCDKTCEFDALSRDDNRNVVISNSNCNGCGACIYNCILKNLTDRKEILPIFETINNGKNPVYALIAPAFISQFSEEVTPGKLRSAFKKLGFEGMIEVALFADILTLKEALEFDRTIHNDTDFLLTSCCCPIWIAMIRKVYNILVPHIPPSVSPMVACGRTIKRLHSESKTVFIGPCVAKKAEAKEKDIDDAVDYVLTFQEVKDIFEAAKINPVTFEEDLRDHSSKSGRIYARTGGVSEAVQATLNRLVPIRDIPLIAKQADGIPACKLLLKEIENETINANFLEGMGCVGGCVGGPKAIIKKDISTNNINKYGSQASYETPVDNPYVIELLNRLGFDTIENLLENDNLFTRKFL